MVTICCSNISFSFFIWFIFFYNFFLPDLLLNSVFFFLRRTECGWRFYVHCNFLICQQKFFTKFFTKNLKCHALSWKVKKLFLASSQAPTLSFFFLWLRKREENFFFLPRQKWQRQAWYGSVLFVEVNGNREKLFWLLLEIKHPSILLLF